MPGHGGGGGGFGGGHSGGTGGGGAKGSGFFGAKRPWNIQIQTGDEMQKRAARAFFARWTVPFLLVLLIVASLYAFLVNAYPDGYLHFDDDVVEKYANRYYLNAFGDLDDTEDEILLIFWVNEACDEYFCVTWVGNHVIWDVNAAFGDLQGSTYYDAVQENVPNNFADSLEDDLAAVVLTMREYVGSMTYPALSTECDGYFAFVPYVFNTTEIPSSVNLRAEMQAFIERTGVPLAVVIDDARELHRDMVRKNVFWCSGSALVCAGAVWLLVVIIQSQWRLCLGHCKTAQYAGKVKQNKRKRKDSHSIQIKKY